MSRKKKCERQQKKRNIEKKYFIVKRCGTMAKVSDKNKFNFSNSRQVEAEIKTGTGTGTETPKGYSIFSSLLFI